MATLGQYNAAEMTAQEVFDAGAAHLLEQGRKSLRMNTRLCAYSSPSGLICGAAPFVQNYTSDMESAGWSELVEDFGQTVDHCSLIEGIQNCHDAYKPKDWYLVLKSLAHHCNLDPAILEHYRNA